MKNNYFSLLKFIAIFFVISIHLNNYGLNHDSSKLNLYSTILYRLFVLPAVPLFLVISGYFTTNSNKKHIDTLKKQLPRILIPYFIWASFYSIYNYLNGVSLNNIIFDYISFQTEGPFYFVFLILFYYLIFPIIKWFSESKIKLLAALFITLSTSIAYQFYSGMLHNKLPIILYLGNPSSFFIFPVIGVYLNKNREVKTSLFLVCILFIFSIIETYLLIKITNNISTSVSVLKPFNILYTIFFIIFLFQFNKINIKNSILTKIGEISYYIFFTHIIFLIIISKYTNHLNSLLQLIFAIIISIILYLSTIFINIILKNNSKYLGI